MWGKRVEDTELLFEGLKVLDVGSWIAAPAAATLLADFGADVIKVELPELGDGYRNYALAPMTPMSDVNYTWVLDARNKRSLSLNLKTEEGLAIFKKMVRDCDVYITNQPLPMRRELGLTYEELSPLNERMIYASLTAYGEEGPDKDREAFDLVAYWSRSGLMNKMRHTDKEPIQAIAGMGDHPTSIAVYASIVTALLRRERTGKGARVYTSLLANGMWSASCLAQAALANADFSSMPHQRMTTALYAAKDGRWIQFSMIRTLEDFDQLLLCLDSIDLLSDERFSTLESRYEHAEEFTEMLRTIIAEKPSDEWMQTFRAADVPATLVAEFEDLATDPQVLINQMVVTPVEDVGIDLVIRAPVNIDGIPKVGVKKAPDLGEHNVEILTEMGYSLDDIQALSDKGII